ncbi:hypothetical protein DID88_005057 [Monilinia fructigena]|uniref:Uncharacterized protein n=1 Tax=Monilinia fructigena TaxID=38457 RepID=A0A395IQE8_9HELO|nr:hypothetical protein DID88_005057 [Monilinia fructigena]
MALNSTSNPSPLLIAPTLPKQSLPKATSDDATACSLPISKFTSNQLLISYRSFISIDTEAKFLSTCNCHCQLNPFEFFTITPKSTPYNSTSSTI